MLKREGSVYLICWLLLGLIISLWSNCGRGSEVKRKRKGKRNNGGSRRGRNIVIEEVEEK